MTISIVTTPSSQMIAIKAILYRCLVLLSVLAPIGCEHNPDPVVVYEDPLDTVWVSFDPRSKSGHDHPFELNPSDMKKILEGLWVVDRNKIVGFGVFEDQQGQKAFSKKQVAKLAPHLSRGLHLASPKDLVTFYLVIDGRDLGPLITSGGLYVQNNRLFFILANWRALPSVSSVLSVSAMEMESRDFPLEPIGVYRKAVQFNPKEVQVPNSDLGIFARTKLYKDPALVVIIDLEKLFKNKLKEVG